MILLYTSTLVMCQIEWEQLTDLGLFLFVVGFFFLRKSITGHVSEVNSHLCNYMMALDTSKHLVFKCLKL